MRLIYTLLLYLLTPFILLRLLLRGIRQPEYRRRWGERFGFVPRTRHGVSVWVHAVSVGESLAAAPLIKRLVAENPPGTVLVTTTTPTGSERVRAMYGDKVLHYYAPYDLPDVLWRYLGRLRPRKVVVMETELWPNLFAALAGRDIPLVIANARLSPRSFEGYGRLGGLLGFTRSTLGRCTHIAAQSPEDAKRFRDLGAEALRVSVMGNIKYDVEIDEVQLQNGRGLRNRIGGERPVWIAASTHEGEEAVAAAAHSQVLKHLPDALLILVPRHPQRFDTAARTLTQAGLRFVRRSGDTSPAEAQALLGDSMGEMYMYYAASDVAFVGGSLVEVGGHNVLEPAALGLPVLFGPHMHNFLAARELLLECKAAGEISSKTLASEVLDLLRFARRRSAMGDAGKTAVLANRGSLAKLLKVLATTKTRA